jgi:hypothetical protein
MTGNARWAHAHRDRGIERRLAPREARFFDAYSRGGERRLGRLVIDYDFVARPRVRALLRRAVVERRLDRRELEEEYRAWERNPDVEAFRRNIAHLASRLVAD